MRKQGVEKRLYQNLRDPTATYWLQFLAHLQGTSVKALYVTNFPVVEQGTDQPVNKAGMNIADVGVNPHNNVPVGNMEGFPQIFALAANSAVLG